MLVRSNLGEMPMQAITDQSFEDEVLNSEIPCVIEFTASWCALCDEMLPKLEHLAEELRGRVKFCTADLEKERGLRIRFAVAAVPYIVYVSDGMQTPLFDQMVPEELLEERVRFMLDGGVAPNTRPIRRR